MKISRSAFAILICVFGLPATVCSSPPAHSGFEVRAPRGLAVTADSRISRNYPQTTCWEFRKNNKSVGFLCLSSSKEFTSDFGITATTSMEGSPEGVRVATGMSDYEMKPTAIHGRRLFTAEVDCDDGDGPQYRATSTCHVAFMPLFDARFIYSNFVLRNEATSTPGVDEKTILRVWDGMSVAPPLRSSN